MKLVAASSILTAVGILLPQTIAIAKADDESRKVRAPTAMELNNINHRILGKAKGKKKHQQCEMKLDTANEKIGQMQETIDALREELDHQDNNNGFPNLGGGDSNLQYYIVPKSGSYELKVIGASGGNYQGSLGGRGAIMEGVFNLEEGDVLRIATGTRGSNGYADSSSGGGGGGGTSIVKVHQDFESLSPSEQKSWLENCVDFNNNCILLIAGGGGGAGSIYPGE